MSTLFVKVAVAHGYRALPVPVDLHHHQDG